MRKDEQIEEMAKDLAQIQCNAKGCEDCEFYRFECDDLQHYTRIAELLTTKGYRKIHDDNAIQCVCYALGCQAAEKIKAEFAREIFAELEAAGLWASRYPIIAELKKRYTEGEK